MSLLEQPEVLHGNGHYHKTDIVTLWQSGLVSRDLSSSDRLHKVIVVPIRRGI